MPQLYKINENWFSAQESLQSNVLAVYQNKPSLRMFLQEKHIEADLNQVL